LLRLTADERGRVLWVKALYSTIEPAKKRKAVMKALSKCLKKRQYPQAAVGVDWEVRTEFLLAFHYFDPIPEEAPKMQISTGRSVPLAWLEEMRQEKVRLAGRLLARSRQRQVAGKGWLLRTDVSQEVVRDIVSSLEFAASAFDAAFPGVPPVPESSPVTIFVFRGEDKLHQVAAFDNVEQIRGRLGGEYSPRDRLIYTHAAEETPPAVIAGTIAHEATHHFVAQRLYAGERRPPFWVTEGIAVLIQCLEDDSAAGLDLSRFRRGKMFKGRWQWKAPAEWHLDTLERSLRTESLPSLRTLLGSEWELSTDIAYGMSWLLVHYLINGEEGKHRAAFTAWVASPSGEGDGESLATALGVTLEELEGAVLEHLKRIL
jgi:hypothetical protein